ncbi:MAG TPA: hypothetical protein VLE74_00595 [Candidatus Saccharimonadales bacterium]|nr:hypothetical protein [Candidatus Saccharimonadales bacterium]
MPLKLLDSNVFKFSKTRRPAELSLSRYFPAGTYYFYGYPSGDASGFLNKVPPAVEELVAARPLVCAGDHVQVVSFANAASPDTLQFISSQPGLPMLPEERRTVLSAAIRANITGAARNRLVKQDLKQLVPAGSLVMAQPFLDEDMGHLYQIPPQLTNWLNDKKNMESFIPAALLAQRYAAFESGQTFSKDRRPWTLPCVVKVSSSSAGDGVYLCKDNGVLQAVRSALKDATGTVIVERYIEAQANYGIQFGIPQNPALPIDIIGVNEQLTTPEGEFIGGVIDTANDYKELETVKQQLLSHILPEVRKMGWYGVGCVDVLVSPIGQPFIIDCNFRMTGMTAYLMLAANKRISGSMMSFSGEYKGSLAKLQETIGHISRQDRTEIPMHIITLTEQDGACRFNAAISFRQSADLSDSASRLLQAGVASKALELFA